MDPFPAASEIVESAEELDSKSELEKNSKENPIARIHQQCSVENEINKLFEAITINNSRRGWAKSGEAVNGALSKSAMKRPMRAGSPQTSGIGISGHVDLKQALRGLCISQASEMAAVRKRLLKSSGYSEAGAVKRLHGTVIIEADESRDLSNGRKGNLMEITLVPEVGTLNKAEESNSSSHYVDASRHETKMTNGLSSVRAGNELTMPDSENKGKMGSARSSVNLRSNAIKSASSSPNMIKSAFRSKNFSKGRNFSYSTSLYGSRNRHYDGEAPKIGRERGGKTSPLGVNCTEVSSTGADSSASTSITSSYPDYMNRTVIVTKKADERLRLREKGEISQSSKSSIGDYSSTTSHSEESCASGSSRSGYRPHMAKDRRWEVIGSVHKQQGTLGLKHFKLIKKLGGGDIGAVYLSELVGTNCLFAVKVLDNKLLASRKKLLRAQTEKEILQMLDHPFLPTLYAHFTTDRFSCLVMEYCPGGDLHVLRQMQPNKTFSEQAARFYVAEVLLALEYLHMLGVVYRDLKPENILIREDGHIMLSDFDLSFRCSVSPQLIQTFAPPTDPSRKTPSSSCSASTCMDPFCLHPSLQVSCFNPRFLSATAKTHKPRSDLAAQCIALPQLVVEPTDARSNSFVGTHEYLAPEIIKGGGHGSAVDWWTFGIFLYELLYGKTPFKGTQNEDTLSNVVSQNLEFPVSPIISSRARDLIRQLLQKEPGKRLGSVKGAAEIKQHPFFEGINWALIRCALPPELPKSCNSANSISDTTPRDEESGNGQTAKNTEDGFEFEMF